VRKHFICASATLAIITAACGGTPQTASTTPTASCSGTGTEHAYVVVEHSSGQSIQRCVAFGGGTMTGKQLMDQSGIPYQTQTFSFGLGVCAVDNEPRQFTECFPKGAPYWSLFVEHADGWAAAQTGFDQVQIGDHDALGWRYVPAADQNPSPPPLAKEA
jgi:hypothetical protein